MAEIPLQKMEKRGKKSKNSSTAMLENKNVSILDLSHNPTLTQKSHCFVFFLFLNILLEALVMQ